MYCLFPYFALYFKGMRNFNYSEIRNQKWDSDILGLIAAIYKEAGKQELYLKQKPQELEKLVESVKNIIV